MTGGFRIHDQSQTYFVTSTIVDWIDLFTRKNYRDHIIDSLRYCSTHRGMIVYAYVIMSNHIHLILQSEPGKLSELLRDFKKFTAKLILQTLQQEPESRREWILEAFRKAGRTRPENQTYQVWQRGNHPEEIYSETFLWTKLNYVHLNPVRAGLVEKASHYLYSSASNYISGSGLLESVEVVAPPVFDSSGPKGVFWFEEY